jgi:hypothetical protein
MMGPGESHDACERCARTGIGDVVGIRVRSGRHDRCGGVETRARAADVGVPTGWPCAREHELAAYFRIAASRMTDTFAARQRVTGRRNDDAVEALTGVRRTGRVDRAMGSRRVGGNAARANHVVAAR